MAKTVLFLSLSVLSAAVAAQTVPQQVTVTGRIIGSPLTIGGFGDTPLARTPIAASLLTEAQLHDAGARHLSDLTRLDAAVSDAYNAEGYWSYLAVRGFQLDNKYNFRRDGLPVNAETVIPLDNKSSIEVLKGTSGIQSGTSAPGGLVNLVVKRPTAQPLRSASIGWREGGSLAVAADLGRRFGDGGRFGLRVNAAHERLRPQLRNSDGERHLLSLAGDWQLGDDTLLEAEVESSRQRQPSQPGFSLLGGVVPDAKAVDPRLSLNNQPWSLPVVFEGATSSLRLTQRLGGDWRFVAHGMTQRLKTDDRIAFPYGCSAEGAFDRYCSDGTVDIYEFESDNERRRSDALDLGFGGTVKTGAISHALQTGVLLTRFKARLQSQVFDFAGVGNVDGSVVVPRSPGTADTNTNRDERSTEFYLHDTVQLAPRWSLWGGLRHTRLDRAGVLTDGSEGTRYEQSFTTPWLALAHQLTPQTMLYASWGQGIESEVVPGIGYSNSGQPLPAKKSRQVEIGAKHDGEVFDASVALFDIDRPQSGDFGTERRLDGSARHRGVEALLSWRTGPWQLHASGMWLDAKRRGAADPAANGLRPTNVAERTFRLHGAVDVAPVQGLSLLASLVHEGDRMVLPDNSARIPAWTRVDLGARLVHQAGPTRLTWRAGVDNVADRRAWKESPYQFGHAYLYPLAPRTWRLSVQADL